ncbi:MAG TPA: hypothetical protein PLR26_00005 [Bacilli bacterium]|nr:hypothetical protein [Bacilli bacterium]
MNERMQILEMLKDGLITAEEADKLLRAMDVNKQEVKSLKQDKTRMLRVDINSAEGDKVHVKVPTSILKFATSKKLIGNIKVDGVDKDFLENAIDLEQIMEMVDSGVLGEIVNIESAQGDIVKIYIE